MAKLTHGVEIELQKYMETLQFRMQEAVNTAQVLEPQLDHLRARLANIEDHVTAALEVSLKESDDMMKNNLQDAMNLQQMIAGMVQAVLEGTSHVAATQERSVQLAKRNNEENSHWAKELANAAASATTLNSQLVCTAQVLCPHTDIGVIKPATKLTLHCRKLLASKCISYPSSSIRYQLASND